MALRRHKYTVGDIVTIIPADEEEPKQCTVAQYLYDETNDCFNYRMNEVHGWYQDKDITLVATYLSLQLGEVILPKEVT